MNLSRVGFISARLFTVCFIVLTAAYCLLAYIPFTYHQVHLGGLLPVLSEFARLHSYLYWPVFVVATLTLPSLRNDRTRSLTVLFVFVYGLVGVRLWAHPLLSQLGNDTADVMWCVLAFTPLVWMGFLDWRATGGEVVWELGGDSETARTFLACLLSAAYVWLLSTTVCIVRNAALPNMGLGSRRWLIVTIWSLISHLTVFMAIFMAVNFTRTLSRLVSPSPVVHSLFLGALPAAIAVAVLKGVVFPGLSFTGALSNVVAVAVAVSTVIFAFSVSVRLYRPAEGSIHSALEFLLISSWLRSTSRAARILILLSGSVVSFYALITAAKFDWGYLLQTLIILVSWTAVLGFFYTIVPAERSRLRSHGESLLIGAAVLLCAYLGLVGMQRFIRSSAAAGFFAAVEDYSNYDVGLRVARGALSPRVPTAQENSLFAFLASNTNIPRSVATPPVEIDLVRSLGPSAAPKPNIFIFVIDSLRRDYISPYNSAVTFTPAIEAFARDSNVIPNAFTHYAGTGLSEPSIWAGAMLLHKQYVIPFYPMNTLQRLLDNDGYRQFITKDEILSTIMKPSPLVTELDAGRPTMSCELCRSLSELRSKISVSPNDRPIFAFTQPQDIHISVINREGRSVAGGDASRYAGFEAAYASRIRRMDECFGKFIRYLKDADLYDNSVIVLTSDHGDSLGEGGRWGHAYNVVPEVVRIPLIVHLPLNSRQLAHDQRALAFLTDITPTLYYLLGHRPIERNPIFGRPLFTETPEEGSSYARDAYLIASSYAPVYAILSNDAQSLYVVDGIEYSDHLYDLTRASDSTTAVTPEIRAARQRIIRESIREIGDFYHFGAVDQTPGS